MDKEGQKVEGVGQEYTDWDSVEEGKGTPTWRQQQASTVVIYLSRAISWSNCLLSQYHRSIRCGLHPGEEQ
jgi:hypothetical protein